MQCPIDQTELVMSDRQGVEIDYCPKCRGVWLDRGELDKIIDRASDPAASRPEARQTTVTSSEDSRGSSSGFFGKVSDSLKDGTRTSTTATAARRRNAAGSSKTSSTFRAGCKSVDHLHAPCG